MGQRETRSYRPPRFNPDSWHPTDHLNEPSRPEHGHYKLHCNNLTSQQVEEYHISYHNQVELTKYLQFFEWREREDNIVKTRFINAEQSSEFCNSHHSAKVYVEHIPVRLSDIQDIPYPQNLYVLFNSLDGFHKLYQMVGYFRVEEDLICMDHDGRVKVWLNSDLSKCHAVGSSFSDEVGNYRKNDKLEGQMVYEIINIVETNTTDEIDADVTFSQFLSKEYPSQGVGFMEAKHELIRYAQVYDADIPNYFESVIGIFDGNHTDGSPYLSRQDTPFRGNGRLSHDNQFDAASQPSFNPIDQSQVRFGGPEPPMPLRRISSNTEGRSTNRRVLSHVPNNAMEYIQPAVGSSGQQSRKMSFGVMPSLHSAQLSTHSAAMNYHPPSPISSPASQQAVNLSSGTQIRFNYQGQGPPPALAPIPGPVPAPVQQHRVSVSSVARAPNVTPVMISSPAVQHHHQAHSSHHAVNENNEPINLQEVQHQYHQQRQSRTQHQHQPSVIYSPPPEEEPHSMTKNDSLKNLMRNQKLIYSDSTDTYQLDPQLAQDMLRYLIN